MRVLSACMPSLHAFARFFMSSLLKGCSVMVPCDCVTSFGSFTILHGNLTGFICIGWCLHAGWLQTCTLMRHWTSYCRCVCFALHGGWKWIWVISWACKICGGYFGWPLTFGRYRLGGCMQYPQCESSAECMSYRCIAARFYAFA